MFGIPARHASGWLAGAGWILLLLLSAQVVSARLRRIRHGSGTSVAAHPGAPQTHWHAPGTRVSPGCPSAGAPRHKGERRAALREMYATKTSAPVAAAAASLPPPNNPASTLYPHLPPPH